MASAIRLMVSEIGFRLVGGRVPFETLLMFLVRNRGCRRLRLLCHIWARGACGESRHRSAQAVHNRASSEGTHMPADVSVIAQFSRPAACSRVQVILVAQAHGVSPWTIAQRITERR
eukprot:7376208-Prymnesium_polylepis.2